MADPGPRPPLVIGVGNELRHDDAAGIQVVRRLRERGPEPELALCELQGEPTRLLDAWRDSASVVLVDTMRSGAPAGTIRRIDASRAPLSAPQLGRGASSSHAVGLAETIELARALDRLPSRVIVYAIEGRRFEAGSGLSKEVRAGLPRIVELVLGEVSG